MTGFGRDDVYKTPYTPSLCGHVDTKIMVSLYSAVTGTKESDVENCKQIVRSGFDGCQSHPRQVSIQKRVVSEFSR